MEAYDRILLKKTLQTDAKWQEILREGDFSKGRGGVKFKKHNLDKIVEHFRGNIIDSGMKTEDGFSELPVNLDHKGGEAAGWIFDLKVDKNSKEKNSLFAKIRFTSLGKEKVEGELFRGFSVEVHTPDMPHLNVETGEKTPFVLVGLALTNEPFIPGMKPVELHAKKKLLHTLTITNMETVKLMLSSLAKADNVSRAELELLNTAVTALNDDEKEEVSEDVSAVETKVEETEAAEKEAKEKEAEEADAAKKEEASKVEKDSKNLSKEKLSQDAKIEALTKDLSVTHSEMDKLKSERREEKTRLSVTALYKEGKIAGEKIVDTTTEMLMSKKETDADEMIQFLFDQPARVDFSELGHGEEEKADVASKIEEAKNASKKAGETALELAARLADIEE